MRTYRLSQRHAAAEASYQGLWPDFHWIPDEDPDAATNDAGAPPPYSTFSFFAESQGVEAKTRTDDLLIPKPKKNDQGIFFLLMETQNDRR